MTVLIIDNHDSFTWNLVQLARECVDAEIVVRANDRITAAEALRCDGILLSPGPGVPRTAGALCEVLRACAPTVRILGVCLGHQAIADVFGGVVSRLDTVYHGVTTRVHVIDPAEALFHDIPQPFEAGLYHSWAVAREPFSPQLAVTAVSDEGLVMALRHREFDVRGVQFHPESVMTPVGAQLLRNWFLRVPGATQPRY
jgi:anthranilate synthase component 2